jgi:hypothetical protein
MTRRGFGLETGFDLKFAFIAKQILNLFEGCIDEHGARCWHFLILLLAGSDFFLPRTIVGERVVEMLEYNAF